MFVRNKPITDPNVLHAAIQIAKLMHSSPERKYIKQAQILLNVTRYIPVADDTFGGTPIESSRGLKIDPPPSPSAPATQPPIKAKNSTIQSVFPSNFKSLSTRLIFWNFFLSICSLATNLQAKRTTQKQDKKNIP